MFMTKKRVRKIIEEELNKRKMVDYWTIKCDILSAVANEQWREKFIDQSLKGKHVVYDGITYYVEEDKPNSCRNNAKYLHITVGGQTRILPLYGETIVPNLKILFDK